MQNERNWNKNLKIEGVRKENGELKWKIRKNKREKKLVLEEGWKSEELGEEMVKRDEICWKKRKIKRKGKISVKMEWKYGETTENLKV